MRNPIIIYEERGDEYTRVTVQVKPTTRRKVPEVSQIFRIKAA